LLVVQHAEHPSASHPDSRSGLEFGEYYYAHDCGIPYERSEHWLAFFDNIAERIVSELGPTSVLDAGCALGMLVESLRKLGVEAYGMDVSEYAIDNADPSVREHVWVATLVEPLPRRYDLITCIEVIEHLPAAEADQAIANLCAASDRVLLSSSPFDYGEPTHVNVRQPEDWAVSFAKHGFVRNLDVDLSFLTPWAMLFERRSMPLHEVVRDYDRTMWRLKQEVQQMRETILLQQSRLEEQFPLREDFTSVKEELLSTRDMLIGTEAQLGDAMGRVRALDAELSRYRIAVEQLEQFRRSPVWRLYEPYHQLRSRLVGRLRALLGKIR
jgi:SAM-dependent methyltransferase